MTDLSDWPPDFLVEAELPNGDLLVMTMYAEPFRKPGWLEVVVRPMDPYPKPIWFRVMVEQGDRDYDALDEALGVLDIHEQARYRAHVPQLLKRN